MDVVEDEPRKHPKPVPFCQDTILKPTVPEVSLILQGRFDSPSEKRNDSFSGTEFQTYNAWRWKHTNVKDSPQVLDTKTNKICTNTEDFVIIKDKYSFSDIEKRKNEILYSQLDEPRRPLPPRTSPVIPTCNKSFFTSFENLSIGDEEIIPKNNIMYGLNNSKKENDVKPNLFDKESDKLERLYSILTEQNKQAEVLQRQIEQLLKLQEVKDQQIEQLLKSQECKEIKIQQLLQSLETKDREVEQLIKLKNKQELQLQELIKSLSNKENENFSLIKKLDEIKRKEVCDIGIMVKSEMMDASIYCCFNSSKADYHQIKEHLNDENLSCIRDMNETNLPETKDKSLSLHLSDFASVPEHVPTPQSSIHVDMQDFQDSSDEDESDDDSSGNNLAMTIGSHSNRLGYTFYNNVLTQVKDIIQNCGEKEGKIIKENLESKQLISDPSAVQSFQAWNVLKENISPMTQLPMKNDYVNRFNLEAPLHCNKDSNSPSDISLKINSLALKYLKKEQISQYDILPQVQNPSQGDVTIYNVTNLSFGSMRYLDRYKILPKAKHNRHISSQFTDSSPSKLLQRKKKIAVQENFMQPVERVLDISSSNQQSCSNFL